MIHAYHFSTVCSDLSLGCDFGVPWNCLAARDGVIKTDASRAKCNASRPSRYLPSENELKNLSDSLTVVGCNEGGSHTKPIYINKT